MEDEEEEDDFRVVLLRFFGRGLAELSRGRAAVQLPSDVISCACDLVVYCIQQEYSDEDAARKEAARWAEDILQSCGEYLGIHLRKQVTLNWK